MFHCNYEYFSLIFIANNWPTHTLKMSLSASVNDQRCRFNTKVAELRATQGKNVRMFTDDEYQEYLRKVKDIKSPGHKMIPADFYLIKRFEVMQVEKDGKLI